MTKKRRTTETTLLDPSVPIEQRMDLLGHICLDGSDQAKEIVEAILTEAASANAESIYHELIEALENGPLRLATFRRMLAIEGGVERAEVVFRNGEIVFPVVARPEMGKTLRDCAGVLVDAQAKVVLREYPDTESAGEIARLERRLDDGWIEVSLQDRERLVMGTSADLRDELDAEEVVPGASLVVCPGRMVALQAAPAEDGLSHYRFVERKPVPDVVLGRDLGAPPAFIEELADLARLEMMNPEVRRRFRLHRCTTKLLVGVSGSGKSYGIQALWRRLYEVMAEVTGAPLEDLPQRVMWLRPSGVLSKWLGDSDKNLDRFFDEVETLASEPFVAPDGRSYELPVLAILEEIDGLARARGTEPVYDRILTTALPRLDTSRAELRDKLIIFIATTNVAHQVDHAFLRRVGGTIEHFGRLNRAGFIAVIDKHLQGCPFEGDDAEPEARRQAVAEVTAWLFSPSHADVGEVELTFAGSTTPVVKRCRDFLTPSVVERAVQQAGEAVIRGGAHSGEPCGLTSEALISALHEQVRSIVDQLSESNAREYVDLPDGVRVARVRRVRQPSIQPYQLRTAG